MKVLDHVGIQDASAGNPGELLWTITLPVHSALETPILVANIQKSVDCESGIVVNDPGRWRGSGRKE